MYNLVVDTRTGNLTEVPKQAMPNRYEAKVPAAGERERVTMILTRLPIT